MDKTFEEMTDEVIYRTLLEDRPSLVAAVADMVRHGQTPAQIERKMQAKFGSIQMVRNVGHIASYLVRQQDSAKEE